MKQLVLLVACISLAHGWWFNTKPGFRVRFDVGFGIGKSHFIPMPTTLSEATNSGWAEVERPPGLPMPTLSLYCPSMDRVVCLFYDDTGYVAGLQVGLPDHLYEDAYLPFAAQGFTKWTSHIAGDVDRDFWTIQQYYVSEETLKKPRSERLAARSTDKFLQEGGVWLTGAKGSLLNVGDTRERIENSIFTKQGCFPNMGRHFYYNMTENSECNVEGLYPWFPIVHNGNLVATGFTSFGKLRASSLVKDYFERPPKLAVKLIVPDGPECLYKLADDPGLVTMHIYYVDNPWVIGCIGQ